MDRRLPVFSGRELIRMRKKLGNQKKGVKMFRGVSVLFIKVSISFRAISNVVL